MLKPKRITLLLLTFFFNFNVHSQTSETPKYTENNKGKFFVYYGGNRENYSKSDIHFKGADYNFTLQDVKAHDKPKGYSSDYINPANITIPQTNFRIGYFFSNQYSISLGLDHMKYVVTQNQFGKITGNINLPTSEEGSAFNGIYSNENIEFTKEFLIFEHTDGLNYINAEIARIDDISALFHIKNTDTFQVNLTEGIGGGMLYPKTNSTLLGKERNDEFHVAGYGVSLKTGINLTFFKHFFFQAELKGGYIDMQDIRTTSNPIDEASQHFFFLQRMMGVGGIFKI